MIDYNLKLCPNRNIDSKILNLKIGFILNNSNVLPINDGFSLPFTVKSLLYFLDPDLGIEKGCPCPQGWFICFLDPDGYIRSINEVLNIKTVQDNHIQVSLSHMTEPYGILELLCVTDYLKTWVLLIPKK